MRNSLARFDQIPFHMPEQLWFTELLNRLFARPATSVLHMLGIQPVHPALPITNFVAMQILVVLALLLLFIFVRGRLSVENPGGLQHLLEGSESFVQGQSQEIIGHHSEGFTPFLVALGFFILICNLIGLIPGFESPTASPSVLKYLKHFAGPLLGLAPLMIPIELISHLARIMSLTIRLCANMFAGELVTLAFFSMIPILLPLPFIMLHLGVSLLQTYIFLLLTMVYLAGAVAEEH
jgi:F-type H+-transporting ATPase subunit a